MLLARADAAIADNLRLNGAALASRLPPPSADAMDAMLDGFAAAMAELRSTGGTHELSAEALERLFTLGFAFEQMRENLRDLRRCIDEWAVVRGTRSRNAVSHAPL